jgi:hypothetical protein
MYARRAVRLERSRAPSKNADQARAMKEGASKLARSADASPVQVVYQRGGCPLRTPAVRIGKTRSCSR